MQAPSRENYDLGYLTLGTGIPMTQKLGLLGHKIGYSLSPMIHKKSSEILGLDVDYELFDFPLSDLDEFIQNFWNTGGLGFNVTTPYKLEVANKMGRKVGAINTVYRGENAWKTTSTDAEGFINSLSLLDSNIEDFDSIFLLGSGGVVLSFLESFSKLAKTPNLRVFRRNTSADKGLISVAPGLIGNIFDFEPQVLKSKLNQESSNSILLIQATNAPLHGNSLEEFNKSVSNFEGTFVDLVYGTPSALFSSLKAKGLRCQDGLPMLVEQARLSQQYWWNDSAPFDEIYNFALRKIQAT